MLKKYFKYGSVGFNEKYDIQIAELRRYGENLRELTLNLAGIVFPDVRL